MKVEQLRVDPDRARELWQKYQTHRAYQTPADAEIAGIYKRIGQGKTVIRAFESIRAAGVDANGLPKLAICPAHMQECWWHPDSDHCSFGKRSPLSRERSEVVRMDWPGLVRPSDPKNQWKWDWAAVVPIIPVHLRPRRGLQNYHILWEADWTKRYPVDPFLLRRFGGDAWLVVAAWDLTDVERAVMTNRLGH